jgi:hypothetical protein
MMPVRFGNTVSLISERLGIWTIWTSACGCRKGRVVAKWIGWEWYIGRNQHNN